jgi:hypothetical protein
MEFFVGLINAFASAGPGAGNDDFAGCIGRALDGFAFRSEQSKENLDSVDAVPKKVGKVRLNLARTEGFNLNNFPERALANRLSILPETQCGRTEDRDIGGFSEAKDFGDVMQRTGHRFIYENRNSWRWRRFDGEVARATRLGRQLTRRFRAQDGFELFEVRAAIDAFEQDGIHVPAHFLDAVIEHDVVLVAQRLGVLLDAIGAGRNIGTAALERGNDFSAGNMTFGFRVVQRFGESGNVGGIAALLLRNP